MLVSFGEIQQIGFIWLVLVLWLGAMGHWALSVELEGRWEHGAGVVQVCFVLVVSASASVQLIINKYGCVLCASWLIQLMVIK